MSHDIPIDLRVNAWSSAGSYLQVRSPGGRATEEGSDCPPWIGSTGDRSIA